MVDRIQKTGRIDGRDPVMDARILDQFMDDVINSVFQTSTTINNIINNIVIVNNNSRIDRFIDADITIEDLIVVLQRNPILADGVTIDIEDGGELLLL